MKVIYINRNDDDTDYDEDNTIVMKKVEELSEHDLIHLLNDVLSACSNKKAKIPTLDSVKYYFDIHTKEELEAAAKLSEECSLASPNIYCIGKYGCVDELVLHRGKIKNEDLAKLYPSSDAASPDFFMKVSLPTRFKNQIEEYRKDLKTGEEQREEKRKNRKIRAAKKLLEKEGIKV